MIDSETGKKHIKDQCLDFDGIAAPGVRVKENRKLINKVSITQRVGDSTLPEEYPCPVMAPSVCKMMPVHISKVLITQDEQWRLIKMAWHQTRRPELGDKFSSRHGQKGVTGLIVQQEDMPFNDFGICPDMIMNPHGYPSRMTVGKLMELLGGKAGVMSGKLHYGTAFGGDKVKDISEELVSHGWNYQGKDCLTSGITGESCQAYIYMGPVYYQ